MKRRNARGAIARASAWKNGATKAPHAGGVKRGESGAPGELRGILTEEAIGDVSLNTDCGVFGRIGGEKIRAYPREAAIPIAAREEVHEGAAVIRSTLKNGRTAEYSIRIEEIDRASDGAKSFRIRVDDPALLAITGGIVRGMSGSPILQDGKLVGAVTHVMINDPTAGYGIFLDNMLQAAQNTQASAA